MCGQLRAPRLARVVLFVVLSDCSFCRALLASHGPGLSVVLWCLLCHTRSLMRACVLRVLVCRAIGCILGELHGRKPLFPGDDYMQQMELILGVLGTLHQLACLLCAPGVYVL